MFILIVLMSFASAGFFSNLFSAKITGYGIAPKVIDECFACTNNNGEWCQYDYDPSGTNSYCKSNAAMTCWGGTWITDSTFCPSVVPIIPIIPTPTITCPDIDANLAHPDGINYYQKGNYGGAEFCGIGVEQKDKVLEYYCTYDASGDPIKSWELYPCPNGCDDGACQGEEPSLSTCPDTDADDNYPSGKNYYEKGWYSGYGDFCSLNPGEENTLLEYYCNYDASGNPVKSYVFYDCSIENMICDRDLTSATYGACILDAQTCDDGIKNQDELGTDCGGVCPACGINQACTSIGCIPCIDSDGFDIFAKGSVNVKKTTTWTTTWDQCDANGDDLIEMLCDIEDPEIIGEIIESKSTGALFVRVPCPTGYVCDTDKCVALATCDDGEQNQDETGVDCGGDICDACPDCNTHADCTAAPDCKMAFCTASGTCDYNENAQEESLCTGGICCDGSCEAKCGAGGLVCEDNNDCTTDDCHHPGICVAECVFYTKRDGVSCDNGQVCCGGNPCAIGELCCPGGCALPLCTTGTCDDSNDCTIDSCSGVGCSANCDNSEYESDNTPCDGGSGMCHDGGCVSPSCDGNSECVPANPESCKIYTCSNPGDWNADCGDVDIISCSMTTDGCCPSTCNSDTDVDCDDHCGDTLGVCDYGETCDTCEGDCGCGSNEYCDTAGTTATCEPGCGSDTDCDGATPKCDSSHDCVECLTASVDDDCGVGYVCDSAGSCKIGMCEYGATNFVFPNTGDTAVVAKFMKNIKSECNAAFTIKILSVSALPTTYNLPLNQKIILILNITSDLTSTAGADLNFIINESELTLPIANLTIYVEDAAEATGWESLVPDAADIVARGNKMFGYNVKTPHFSLFLITEPELCGNGVFDTGFEVCDGSVSGVNHCTACSCDIGYHTTASGDCERDITGTDCSLIGNKSCSGFKLLECSSNLVWENEGLVIGECGVDCLAGNKSCQGEVSLLCNLNYDWTIQGVINGLCGYVVDPDAPSDRCGNGYCNYDEDEASCPEDCEADPEDIGEINWGLIALIFGIVVLILVIIIVLFKMFNKEKGRGMPPPNRRLPPEHRPGPKRAPGRPLEHNLPVGRPAAGQGPYSRRRYPPR